MAITLLNHGNYPPQNKTIKPLMIALLTYVLTAGVASSRLCAQPAKPITVRYPAVIDQHTREFDPYFIRQLQLALEKSGVPFHLDSIATQTLVESRSALYLRDGRYDVHWLHSNKERERNLIPIRVPLFKGLIGWRLYLIRKGDQARFSAITRTSQLQALIHGQGHDWPDTDILKSNGFNVETSSQWSSLFTMLALGRLDAFPRSIVEIQREAKIFSHLDIEIEQSLALHYRAAYYFFVSPKRPGLAKAIERGLHKAIEDGSFDRNYNAFFGDLIAQAQLHKRRIVDLTTNDLNFPSDEALWLNPPGPRLTLDQIAPLNGDKVEDTKLSSSPMNPTPDF